MISELVLKYLGGERLVRWPGYETTLYGSSQFRLTVPNNLVGRHSRFENNLVGQYDSWAEQVGVMDWEEALPRQLKAWDMQSVDR